MSSLLQGDLSDRGGCTSIVKHAIHTEGHPIRQPVRHQPKALHDTIDIEVQQMLQNGIIQPSFSPWSSPIVMVKKKDAYLYGFSFQLITNHNRVLFRARSFL